MTNAMMAQGGNQVAVYDEALLKQLSGLVNKDDTGGLSVPRIPKLKINNKEGLAIPPGYWVIGQELDEAGNVTDPGKKVIGLIILAVRRQYSYYHHTKRENNCTSRLFVDGERDIVGLKHKHICAQKNACPYRDPERNPRCSQQLVTFGIAITEDHKQIDCACYLKGTSYMPYQEYLESATRLKTDRGFVELPPFAFFTLLGSRMEVKGGKTYFVAQFKKGNMIQADMIPHLTQKRDEVYRGIGLINEALMKPKDGQGQARPAQRGPVVVNNAVVNPQPASAPQVSGAAFQNIDDVVIDVEATPLAPAAPAMPQEEPEDIPFNLGAPFNGAGEAPTTAPAAPTQPGANDVDFDIKAAIEALM